MAGLATTIRLLVVGDETIPADLVDKCVRRLPRAVLASGYSLAECSGGVCVARHESDRPVSHGRPLDNVRAYVLDRRLRVVPAGVIGEVYVAGAGTALGFAGEAALTAERFVADPFRAGERMYRTGDLGRRDLAGELEVVGRTDRQVRIGGRRIDLDGIAATLCSIPSVRSAEILVREDRPGDRRLVSYVVTDGDADVVGDRLREVLPDVVSASVVRLDALPLTPAGTVDRHALPVPNDASVQRTSLSVQEQILCELFADVLGVDRVEPDANFFTIGGHSMLAVQLVNRIRSVLGTDIGIRALLQAPVVAELSRVISAAEMARSGNP
jgi:acyl-CoA synthetase (AMP-forming)/AMP-acid ligase II